MREGLFVCVTNLEGPVRQSYMVSRLDRIIPLYDDRETALRAVGDYGLGRIAVGKLELERLAAASGTAEKPTRAPGPSASAALAGQASAAMASAAESWSGVGQKLHHASQTITRQQMLQLGGAAALVLVLGSVAYYLLAPARSDGAISSSDDRPLSYGGEGPLALSGQVQVRAGDHAREDSGALILLWPAGETPPQKVLTKTIYRYLNEAAVSDEFPHPWMHAARASETGKFRIGLKTPGEFEVLIISASTESSSTLTSADEQTLAAWFESPRELIGRHPYRLQRQRVDNSAAALSQIFERRGSR